MVALDVRIKGSEQVLTRIDRLAANAKDLTSVWPAVGRWYGERARRAFVEGQTSWAPLKASYLRRKRSRRIAILSGSLRVHATEDTPDVTAATYALFGVTRADPATIVQRARYLKRGRRSMKSRNVVPAIRAGERRQISQIIGAELMKGP